MTTECRHNVPLSSSYLHYPDKEAQAANNTTALVTLRTQINSLMVQIWNEKLRDSGEKYIYFIYICIRIHTHIYIYIYIYVHVYTHTHTHTYIYIYIYIYTYMYVFGLLSY